MEMTVKIPKKAKIIFAVFIILLVVGIAVPIVHAASYNYDEFPKGLIDHIEVSTGWNKITRNASFGLLKFLAEGVTGIEKQVSDILRFDVLSLFNKLGIVSSDGLLSRRLVITVFSIFMLVGACTLVIFRSKIHLSEFLVGILTSLALIIALPLFINTFNSMKNAGLSDVNSINYSDSAKYYTIGDEILSSQILDIGASAKNSKLTYYSDLNEGTRQEGSVFNIDINATLSNKQFDKKVESIIYDNNSFERMQKEYSELKTSDKMQLLGLGREYDLLIEAYDNGQNHDIVDYSQPVITGTATSIQEEMEQRYNKHFVTYTYYEYYEYVKQLLCNAVADRFPDDYSVTKARLAIEAYERSASSLNMDGCCNVFEKNLTTLLRKHNYAIVTVSQSDPKYQYEDLKTFEDFDNESAFEQLGDNIKTFGEPVEYIYQYDYDFWTALVILVALIVALIFAGLKIAAVMYDMIFVQIIAGIVIATDQQNKGRAKKTIQELFNSYLIFILCTLLIKIFIMLSLAVIKTPDLSQFIKIILIIGFAKATIDGPDFIVKIIGTDAGVKSGMGTIMAINQGVNLTRSAVSPAARFAKGAAKTTTGVASGIASGFVSGSVSGAQSSYHRGVIGGIGGAVGGAFSGGSAGHNSRGVFNAFSSGSHSGYSTGNSFGNWVSGVGSHSSENSGDPSSASGVNVTGSAESSSSAPSGGGSSSASSSSGAGGSFAVASGSSAVKGDKGDKGDRGLQGMQGEHGLQGEQGQRETDGRDAQGASYTSSAHSTTGSNAGQAFNNTASAPAPANTTSSPANTAPASTNTAPAPSAPQNYTFAEKEHYAESSALTYSDSQIRAEHSAPAFSDAQTHAEASNSFADIERHNESHKEDK